MPIRHLTGNVLLEKSPEAQCDGCDREPDDSEGEWQSEVWTLHDGRMLCPECSEIEGVGPLNRG